LLLEQLHFNLLFRWFVDLSQDDPIWHRTTYSFRDSAGSRMS
jgi:transposase